MGVPTFDSPDAVIDFALSNQRVTLRLIGWELEQVPERIREIPKLEFLDLRYNRINFLPEWITLEPDFESDDYVFGKVLLKGNPIAGEIVEFETQEMAQEEPPRFDISKLANDQEEIYCWDDMDNLTSICTFENNGLDIFYKAILALEINRELKAEVLWKYGAKVIGTDCKAEILVLDESKKINVRTAGVNKRKFLREILDSLCEACDSNNEKPVSMGFPGCCQFQNRCHETTRFCFYYEDLRILLRKKKRETPCPKSDSLIQVHELLDLPRFIRRVYISYSPEDLNYCKELKTFLSPFEDEMILWDNSKIELGQNVEETSKFHFSNSEVVIYLVSKNFESNYKIKREEYLSIETKINKAVLVIPIIISPCLWKDSNGKWRGLQPANETEISESQSKDAAWTEISEKIIKRVRGWQPEN